MDIAKAAPMETLNRITHSPGAMGVRCIRRKRVTVGAIVGMMGAGYLIDLVLTDYPDLERDDVLQALRYAAWRAGDREIALVGA